MVLLSSLNRKIIIHHEKEIAMSNALGLGSGLFCVVAFLLVAAVIFFFNAVRVIPEYQRLVVFRLGRVLPTPKGPGIVLLIPFFDRAVKVDLREQVREVPHQTCITKDNAPISIDFLWYYKVIDAAQSVLQVGNFESAAAGIAATTRSEE